MNGQYPCKLRHRITHVPHHGSVCEKATSILFPLSLSCCSWGPRIRTVLWLWILLIHSLYLHTPQPVTKGYTDSGHLTTSDPLSVVSLFLYWKLLKASYLTTKNRLGFLPRFQGLLRSYTRPCHPPFFSLSFFLSVFLPPSSPSLLLSLKPYFLPETLLASLCSQTYTKQVHPPCFTPANLSACAGYELYPLLHPVFTSDIRDVFSSHSI